MKALDSIVNGYISPNTELAISGLVAFNPR